MTGSTILCSTPGTEKPNDPSFSGGSGLSLLSKVCGPSVSVMPSELALGTSASSCWSWGRSAESELCRTADRSRSEKVGWSTSALAMCGQPSTWVTRSRSMSSRVAPRLELLLEHERGARVHGRDEGEAEPAHPEERHRRVEHVVAREVAHLPEVVGVAHRRAVGVHRALRVRRAARGVDDHHRVGRRHLGLALAEQRLGDGVAPVRQLGHRRGPGPPPRTPGPDAAQVRVALEEDLAGFGVGQPRYGLLEALEVVVAEVRVDRQQHLDVGVAEHPPELAGLAVGVEEDDDGPDPAGRQPADDPVRAVGGEEPHPRALSDARRQEAAGEASRAGVDLGVGRRARRRGPRRSCRRGARRTSGSARRSSA